MASTKARLLKHDVPVHGATLKKTIVGTDFGRIVGTGKRGHYERGLFTGGISRISKISRFSRICRK